MRTLANCCAVIFPGILICSSALGAEPVKIEIGNLATLPFAKPWLDREITRFESEYPEIEVVRFPYSDPNRFEQPLHTNPYLPRNIIGLDSSEGAEAAYLAEKGDIVPIEEFLPDPDFDMNQYYSAYWDSVRYADKTWGVPWQVRANILICNMTMFREAGIDVPPASWDELLAVSAKLTRERPDGSKQWGLRVSTYGNSLLDVLISLILQQDGRLFKDGKIDGSDPLIVSSVLMLKQLVVDSGAVKLEDRRLVPNEADKGTYAMQLVQTPQLTNVLGDPDYQLAPMPALEMSKTLCPRRFYFVIRRSTPEQEEASWELVKWLSRKDVSLPTKPLGYPCRRDIVEHPNFEVLAARAPKNVETIFTSAEHTVDIVPPVLNRSRALAAWGQGLLPILMGAPNPQAVSLEAAAKANEILVPLPSVRENKKSLGIYK